MTDHEILVHCFKSLGRRQKNNLRYHLEQKTLICCGRLARAFTDGKGGG